jgi:hypothetical protein
LKPDLPQKSSPLKPAEILACLARSDSGCGKFVANPEQGGIAGSLPGGIFDVVFDKSRNCGMENDKKY